MEKSIESIWKEGFLKSEALIAPKLNSLYNRKSKHIVDNLMAVGKKNIVGIVLGAFLVLALAVILKSTPAGIFLFLILMWLAYKSRKERDRMQEIDHSLNTYEYIKAVDLRIKEVISSYTKIYRIVYPTIVLAFSLGMWYSSIGSIISTQGDPGDLMIWGIPGYWMLVTLIGAGLMSIFAGSIYRFDVNMVYGRILSKLEEIIADMEELAK